MKKITIAIDGFSGTGKSSTAKAVASHLDYAYIDSGAMYRAIAFGVLKEEIKSSDLEKVIDVARNTELRFTKGNENSILANGIVLQNEIRTDLINANVSWVAAIPEVRREMVRQQQAMGSGGGIVMDGRDIGTVVFPNADLKIFMTASDQVRARRRQMELKQKGIDSDFETILENLRERDRIDSTRQEGPLKRAEGAMEIDTTDLTFKEQVEAIVSKAKKIIDEN